MVREEWKKLGNLPIQRKLRALHLPLRRWNKEKFGNIDQAIKKFEKEQLPIQEKIDTVGGDVCDFARLSAIETQLQKWLDRKASYWKQLFRDIGLREGIVILNIFTPSPSQEEELKEWSSLRVVAGC